MVKCKRILIFVILFIGLIGIILVYKVFKGQLPEKVYILEDNIRHKYINIKDRIELIYVEYNSKQLEVKSNFENPPKLIAHAGGEIKNHQYTNSLDALNFNYGIGYRYFEMDISITSDSQLAMIHDWNGAISSLFESKPKKYSLSGFKNLKMIDGLHQISFDELKEWIYKHQDAHIITDIKEDNIKALQKISKDTPEMLSHIIPQIYSFSEYSEVRKLGYNDIILTLYVKQYDDDLVLEFVKSNKVMAVTMPSERAETDLPIKLSDLGIFTYAHTINDEAMKYKLEENGVKGFYTDSIKP